MHQEARLNYRLAQHSGVPGVIIACITKKTMPVAYLLTFTRQCVSIATTTVNEVKLYCGKVELAY